MSGGNGDVVGGNCIICYENYTMQLSNDEIPVTGDDSDPPDVQNPPWDEKTKTEICQRFGVVVSRFLELSPIFFRPEKTLQTKQVTNVIQGIGVCDGCLPDLDSFCQMYDLSQQVRLKMDRSLDKLEKIVRGWRDKEEEPDKQQQDTRPRWFRGSFAAAFLNQMEKKRKQSFPLMRLVNDVNGDPPSAITSPHNRTSSRESVCSTSTPLAILLNHCFLCATRIHKEASFNFTENAKICENFGTLVTRYLNLKACYFNSQETLGSCKHVHCDYRVCVGCLPEIRTFCQIYHKWQNDQLELRRKLEVITENLRCAAEDPEQNDRSFTFKKDLFQQAAGNRLSGFPKLTLKPLDYLDFLVLPPTSNIIDFEIPFIAIDQEEDEDDVDIEVNQEPPLEPVPELKVELEEFNDDSVAAAVCEELSQLSPSEILAYNSSLPGTPTSTAIERIEIHDFDSIFTPDVGLQTSPSPLKVADQNVSIHTSTEVGPACILPPSVNKPPQVARKRTKGNITPTASQRRPKLHSCTVPNCTAAYDKRSKLIVHMRKHTGDRPFQCSVCPRSFAQKGNYQRHLQTHTGEKPFVCTCCDKHFASNDHLKRHERSHTGERPYACSSCPKAFSTAGDLKRHEWIHAGVRAYKCRFCEVSFTLLGNLRVHEKQHMGDDAIYQCKHCKIRFISERTVKIHEKTHVVGDPSAAIKCEFCKKCFPTEKELHTHWRKAHKRDPQKVGLSKDEDKSDNVLHTDSGAPKKGSRLAKDITSDQVRVCTRAQSKRIKQEQDSAPKPTGPDLLEAHVIPKVEVL